MFVEHRTGDPRPKAAAHLLRGVFVFARATARLWGGLPRVPRVVGRGGKAARPESHTRGKALSDRSLPRERGACRGPECARRPSLQAR